MSHYITIDHKRYDRSLYEMGQSLTRGRGDGRISHDDAQKLFEAAGDGGSITETERDTILFLLETLRWTDRAEDWMREALGPGPKDHEGCVRAFVEQQLIEYWQARYEAHKAGQAFEEEFLPAYAADRESSGIPTGVAGALDDYVNAVEQADFGKVHFYRIPGTVVSDFCPVVNVGAELYLVRTSTDGDDGWVEFFAARGNARGYGRTLLELVSWGEKADIRAFSRAGGFPDELQERRSESLWGK